MQSAGNDASKKTPREVRYRLVAYFLHLLAGHKSSVTLLLAGMLHSVMQSKKTTTSVRSSPSQSYLSPTVSRSSSPAQTSRNRSKSSSSSLHLKGCMDVCGILHYMAKYQTVVSPKEDPMALQPYLQQMVHDLIVKCTASLEREGSATLLCLSSLARLTADFPDKTSRISSREIDGG